MCSRRTLSEPRLAVGVVWLSTTRCCASRQRERGLGSPGRASPSPASFKGQERLVASEESGAAEGRLLAVERSPFMIPSFYESVWKGHCV